MKITDIKVHVIKPFGALKNVNGWETKKYVYSYVQVLTDVGIDGWALSALTGGSPLALESSIQWIKKSIVGMDALNREQVYRELHFGGSFFRLNRFFSSAIDFCLWDIAGKAFGVPVYQLIGGFRDKIRAYGSSVAYDNIEEYLDDVQKAADQGYTAYKLHGFNNLAEDIQLCEAARERFPAMDFLIDTLCYYDRKDALTLGRVLDRMNFVWYEDPLREEDHEGWRMLRSKLDLPLANGEMDQLGFLNYQNYITQKSADIIRPFGDYMGGITPMLKTAHLCETFFIGFEPHSFGPSMVQIAHLHVMLAVPSCTFFEIPVPEGFYDHGMKDGLHVDKDGYIHAPTEPGLGYQLDFDWIANNTERVL